MIEPTDLFLTLCVTTPDGVNHKRYVILDVEDLDQCTNPKKELYHHYRQLRELFREEFNEKAETVS